MKQNKKIYMILLSLIFIASCSYIVMAINAEPGSTEDPLVTKNYVESQNQQLKSYIDESIKNLKDSLGGSSGQTNLEGNSSSYEIVEVAKGKKLVVSASTEIILRAGIAKAIDSKYGGLADVTQGIDLKLNQNIPSNHLLIIPRNDGRGAHAVTDCIFMVKGSYTIK